MLNRFLDSVYKEVRLNVWLGMRVRGPELSSIIYNPQSLNLENLKKRFFSYFHWVEIFEFSNKKSVTFANFSVLQNLKKMLNCYLCLLFLISSCLKNFFSHYYLFINEQQCLSFFVQILIP